MRKRLCVLAALPVAVLLAGCGGGASSGGNGGGTGGGGNSNPTTVTFTFQGALPAAVAAKIGSGSFTAQTVSSGTLTLSIPSGTTTLAVVYLCPAYTETAGPSQFQINQEVVNEVSTADGTQFYGSCPQAPATGQTGTLTASVDASAVPGVSILDLDAVNGSNTAAELAATATASFSFAAPAGTDRVELFAFNQQITPEEGFLTLVAAKDFSGQAVPGALNGGSTVALGAADEVTAEPITYANVPSGYSAPTTEVTFNVNGSHGVIIEDAASNSYPALPVSAVESGDTYLLMAHANDSSNIANEVMCEQTTSSAGPASFTFPTPWTYAGPTAAALPTFTFAYTGFSGSAAITDVASLFWSPSSTMQDAFVVTASTNYLSGSTSLAMPDLSGVAGFLPAPVSGTSVSWGASVNQGIPGVAQASLSPNETSSTVTTGGRFTVP